MFKKLLAVLVVSFVLVGCGDGSPKMDVSSKETFQTSMTEMSAKLDPQDKDDFGRAVMKVLFAAGAEFGNDEAKIQQSLKDKLGGKTAKEIIKEYANN